MQESIHKIVKTVASPLRFFVVAIIVLGSIIIALTRASTLPSDVALVLILVTFGTLIFIIALVTFLVIQHPKKLVFDQEAHLTVMREGLGDSELPNLYSPGLPKNAEPPKQIGNE